MHVTVFSLAATTALLVGRCHGFGLKPSPETTRVEKFKWQYPFEPSDLQDFNPICETTQNFPAREYTLHVLADKEPLGLLPWSNGLRKFFAGRVYPGGWAGWDRHLHDRTILKMEYEDMPIRVREWIEEQDRTDGEGKGLYAVFKKPETEEDSIEETVVVPAKADVDRAGDKNKVAIFAPGALYSNLPLWVAQGSNCEESFLDLKKYAPKAADAGVIAWPSHTKPGAAPDLRGISISIRALMLALKPGVAPKAIETESPSASSATSDASASAADSSKAAAESSETKDEL